MKKIIPEDSVLVPEGAKLVFQGKIFATYQWPQKLFDGSEYTFEMLKRTDTVSVICVVDGKLLVIDDEQPHLGTRRSFPGGRVDPTDDTVEAAAKREVLEETGYSLKNWKLLKVHQPYRKIEWFVHVFLAWDTADKQEPALDPGEKISVEQLSFDEVRSLAIGRKGYLGESSDIFEGAQNLDGLFDLPEFKGQEVDR
ncbi:MAG TPA: NUDIX hydrolase [Candidatus Saccharimonadales bacterium]|nr:NUDIX hydrolase [Candidatus Saccharimonadales bacterium]